MFFILFRDIKVIKDGIFHKSPSSPESSFSFLFTSIPDFYV